MTGFPLLYCNRCDANAIGKSFYLLIHLNAISCALQGTKRSIRARKSHARRQSVSQKKKRRKNKEGEAEKRKVRQVQGQGIEPTTPSCNSNWLQHRISSKGNQVICEMQSSKNECNLLNWNAIGIIEWGEVRNSEVSSPRSQWQWQWLNWNGIESEGEGNSLFSGNDTTF